MITIFAYFVGISAAVWAISLVLTFIWRKRIKKEITHKIIIISTIIAGIIRFLISSAFTIDLMEVILIIVAIPLVIWIRLPKKYEREN